jgi:hypothetical protein
LLHHQPASGARALITSHDRIGCGRPDELGVAQVAKALLGQTSDFGIGFGVVDDGLVAPPCGLGGVWRRELGTRFFGRAASPEPGVEGLDPAAGRGLRKVSRDDLQPPGGISETRRRATDDGLGVGDALRTR